MSSPAEPWTETFRVRSDEITPNATLSIPALCTYLQEAAGHHAEQLGVSIQRLQKGGQAWVLAHLHVEIDRLPEWEDEIVVETWPSGIERLYATREFLLRTDDRLFARATSAWLVFDTERRRPARPPKRLHAIDLPNRPDALEHDWSDLAPPDRTDCSRTFDVRYHDLDVNRHVNNVHLLEWALETLPSDVLDTHRCRRVALQFVGETRLGDPVDATAKLQDEGPSLTVRHALDHATDDRTLAVAQTEWEEDDPN